MSHPVIQLDLFGLTGDQVALGNAPLQPAPANSINESSNDNELAPVLPPPLPVAPVHADPAKIESDATDLPKNLAELRALLAVDTSQRGADMRSAVATFGRVIGRPLASIETDPSGLRILFNDAVPGAHGVNYARWSRIRSLMTSALVSVGFDVQPAHTKGGPGGAWKDLHKRLESRRLMRGLSRLLSHFTLLRIAPGDVTVTHFEAFRERLEDASLLQKPNATFRNTVRYWNEAVRTIEGWPAVVIDLDPDPRRYSLPWETFPASFRGDVEAFTNSKGETDYFADDCCKPVRAVTAKGRRMALQQLASALVHAGTDAEAITSLSVLTDPQNAMRALRYLCDRRGGTTPQIANQARLLLIVSRHWVKNAAQTTELARYASRLAVKKAGMTEKNKKRLRQFDVEKNVAALLLLPRRIYRELDREQSPDRSHAVRALFGLATEILIMTPIRLKNLVELELGRQIHKQGVGSRARYWIDLTAEETKNREAFSAPLPPETGALINVFIQRYRPLLTKAQTALLFPGRGDRVRSKDGFSTQVPDFLKRETGLLFNAHLFRALAGKLYLDVNPHDVETVRQVLAHRSSATTLKAYVGLDAKRAVERYDALIGRIRSGLSAAKGTRHDV